MESEARQAGILAQSAQDIGPPSGPIGKIDTDGDSRFADFHPEAFLNSEKHLNFTPFLVFWMGGKESLQGAGDDRVVCGDPDPSASLQENLEGLQIAGGDGFGIHEGDFRGFDIDPLDQADIQGSILRKKAAGVIGRPVEHGLKDAPHLASESIPQNFETVKSGVDRFRPLHFPAEETAGIRSFIPELRGSFHPFIPIDAHSELGGFDGKIDFEFGGGKVNQQALVFLQGIVRLAGVFDFFAEKVESDAVPGGGEMPGMVDGFAPGFAGQIAPAHGPQQGVGDQRQASCQK